MKDITEHISQMPAFKPSVGAPAPGIPHPTTQAPARPLNLARCILTASQLTAKDLPPRQRLLGEWLREGDLGYVFAPRGHGKTWLAMLISNALAEGCPLGRWAAGESPLHVVYFDAEMNLQDVQDRARKLGIDSPNFHWLSNEFLYLDQEVSLNIANPAHQAALSAQLPDGSVLVIDNLSTGQSGMRENENDDFDTLKDWLLSLRRRGVTVLIVHHAGRNGEMRGGSRREDPAHWILSLKDATEEGSSCKGFVTRFTKCRNCQEGEAPPLRWTLRDDGRQITLTSDLYHSTDVLLGHIRDGVTSATELAEMLGVHCGTVSKWAKKLMQAGLIRKSGRGYQMVEAAETRMEEVDTEDG